MNFRLVRYRTLPCPTLFGWVVLILLAGMIPLFWAFRAEHFLSLNSPAPAEILWLRAGSTSRAQTQPPSFETAELAYKYVVAAAASRREMEQAAWSYAEIAAIELHRRACQRPDHRSRYGSGRKPAHVRDCGRRAARAGAERHRGFRHQRVHRGPHARRSRLVFSKSSGTR